MQQVRDEAMAAPYDLLLGRKTYDSFSAHHAKDANQNKESGPMDLANKYVVTSGRENLRWANSTPVSGNIAEEIAQLKSLDGKLLQVHGSWQLIQTLMETKLIDEFRLWTFPVMLGSGKKLFDKGCVPTNLKLIKTQSTQNGVVMAIYRREDDSPG